MSTSTETIEQLATREYKYGFYTDVEADTIPKGLSEDVVRMISAKKEEPDWLLEWRGELAAAAEHDHSHLVRFALGSFADAFWIRQRDVADLQVIDDLRHGMRQWRQQAAFAITAIGILSLSMAGSVTAFSVVSQILLRPLPYHDPDHIVAVFERQPAASGRSDVAPGNFIDWRDRATSFTTLAGYVLRSAPSSKTTA